MGVIYKIENLTNSKKVVGSTKNRPNFRKNSHWSLLRRNLHKNPHLQNAWNKYGEMNFKFEILEECKNEDLLTKEEYWKNLLNAEYNIAPINRPLGTINLGRKHKPETIEKMKKIRKGKKMPDWFGKFLSESRKGSGNPMFGKKLSEETKQKLSLSKKGKKKPPFSKIHIENLKKSHLGKNLGSTNYNFSGRYKFIHPTFGEEVLGQCELIKKYNLKQSKIPLICNGSRKSYMGWKCLGKI